MGTWSHEPFGNDSANDWAYGLEEAGDLRYLEETLDKAIDPENEYLDAGDAEEAVAAAEVVAKLLGKGTQTDSYTAKTDEWVRTIGLPPTPELRRKAAQALRRALSENSELRELWEETEEAAIWRESVERLLGMVED